MKFLRPLFVALGKHARTQQLGREIYDTAQSDVSQPVAAPHRSGHGAVGNAVAPRWEHVGSF